MGNSGLFGIRTPERLRFGILRAIWQSAKPKGSPRNIRAITSSFWKRCPSVAQRPWSPSLFTKSCHSRSHP